MGLPFPSDSILCLSTYLGCLTCDRAQGQGDWPLGLQNHANSGFSQKEGSAQGSHSPHPVRDAALHEVCPLPRARLSAKHFRRCGLTCSSLSRRPSQPLLDRSIPDFAAFTTVDDWLSAIKMVQYRDSFLTAGFTSLQLVTEMTSE